jgi:hypothetical protein
VGKPRNLVVPIFSSRSAVANAWLLSMRQMLSGLSRLLGNENRGFAAGRFFYDAVRSPARISGYGSAQLIHDQGGLPSGVRPYRRMPVTTWLGPDAD